MAGAEDLDTSHIREWRSIVTLVAFVLTNIVVLFPFTIPIYIPKWIHSQTWNLLSKLRIVEPRDDSSIADRETQNETKWNSHFVKLGFPMNLITAPLITDLFLLAIGAIGRQEVHDGTIGTHNISPLDIMIFFITLAYIAISIDASGLIRFMAYKILQKGGKAGHRLFFYLYVFFFGLGSFIGNDPIILSGTPFLAYMTRVSSNIVHPRAWIYTQFAVSNVASAILVSSNPTNLVLAGAFQIRFIHYTANMIVPVVITAIILFPCLLYWVFADQSLIPTSIKMHELPEELRAKKPVNPNIPFARGQSENTDSDQVNAEQNTLHSLEEIMNPFLDKSSAAFGAVLITITLITVLALNAASKKPGQYPVFWVTLPAAFVMFCWDIGFGWYNRHETREIARKGRIEAENAHARRFDEAGSEKVYEEPSNNDTRPAPTSVQPYPSAEADHQVHTTSSLTRHEIEPQRTTGAELPSIDSQPVRPINEEKQRRGHPQSETSSPKGKTRNLVSITRDAHMWARETFPTTMTVLSNLPLALVPFAFAMVVLVQALVTKGWVPVFAYGWDHWVNKTGTVGSIGGMAFLSVILCNFAGTNIGTTILLSRVIQAWQEIHRQNGIPISDRTFWAAVYSMAIGVNYGAFSTSFSASLAGLLWRDILARKRIFVRDLDFARINLPIIAITMIIGCTVLIGEVYIIRDTRPYRL